MNADAETLFHELADLSPAEREARFRERRVPADLRAEVEQLLRFDATGPDTLTASVAASAERLLEGSRTVENRRCGPYRLLRLLGRGGMGSVYLAERADGEVEQRVAIKLLRFGGDDPNFLGRFLRERQILATLSHPGIARLLDAGHTEDGQPYLVMEYVDGVPIDEYARELEPRNKLRLLLRVCEAVTHLHRNLIVHRDLKPSNILVDAAGEPKLLDFGIAKILDPVADQTRTRDCLATPEYASPEQLEGEGQTTATDVYSLGAVALKLLTGCTPREARTSPATRPDRSIPADLQCVLRKALRPEPEKRYASVDALAADIRAFLESRPVEARSGDAWYRGRKFLRRYWAPVAGAALVIASLSAGLYIANRERLVAERRFGQLRRLSDKVFDLDNAIRHLPGSVEARQELVTASLEYLEGLAAEARGDPGLQEELAAAYERVARVQGVPTESNLGQFDKAEQNLKRADALADSVLAARPGERNVLRLSAHIAADRMIVADYAQRQNEAIGFARKAIDRSDALLARGPAIGAERDEIGAIYGNIATFYRGVHRSEDAVRQARRAVEISRTMPPGNRRRLAMNLSTLAGALGDRGELAEALQSAVEARQIAGEPSNQPGTTSTYGMYGILFREGMLLGGDGAVSLGRSAAAVEALEGALDIAENAARGTPKEYLSRSRVAEAARELGKILRHHDPQRALEIYDRGIQAIGEVAVSALTRRDRGVLLADSADPLVSLNRDAEAKQRIDAAIALLTKAGEYPAGAIAFNSGAYAAMRALADYYAHEGDSGRASRTYEQLLAGVMAANPGVRTDLGEANRLSVLYQAMAELYRKAGEEGQSREIAARRLDLWKYWDQQLPGNSFVTHQLASR